MRFYESRNTAIPISNLSTSLSSGGIRATTILIGNVIAECGLANRRMFRNSAGVRLSPFFDVAALQSTVRQKSRTRKARRPCRAIQGSEHSGILIKLRALLPSFRREQFGSVASFSVRVRVRFRSHARALVRFRASHSGATCCKCVALIAGNRDAQQRARCQFEGTFREDKRANIAI